jgi:enamine deaminase RidA (YjgF/YER057c/UK114 family)
MTVLERMAGAAAWPRAVKTDGFIFLSGQVATDPGKGTLIAGYDDLATGSDGLASGNALVDALEGPTAAQIWFLYQEQTRALEALGSSDGGIVQMNGWYADFRDWPTMDRLRRTYYDADALPVSTSFQAGHMPVPGARAMYDAIAVTGEHERTVVGNPIQVGSYAAGSRVGELVFLAGEVPADPATGLVVRGFADLGPEADAVRSDVLGLDGWEGRIRAQTWFVYQRIAQTLSDAGSSLEGIVKQTVYLRDVRDFPAFDRLSRELLGAEMPATTLVAVEQYGHPGFDLEVEVVAVTAGARRHRVTAGAPSALGAEYPLGIQAGPFLFLSGRLPSASLASDAEGPGGLDGRARAQASEIYADVEGLLAGQGLDMSALVRQMIYVRDPAVIPAVEDVALRRTAGAPPATTFVGVNRLVPSPALVQIDFTCRAGA